MNTFSSGKIKNLVLLGHSGEGKTSLAEAMLYNAKSIDRLGKVDSGTATMDFDSEEINRKISISLSAGYAVWKDYKFNILDAPGFFDFQGEVVSALKVADFAVIVNGANGYIPVGTEKAFEWVQEQKIPAILFINGINKDNANYEETISAFKEHYPSVKRLQLPIFENNKMIGAVNVVDKKAYMFDGTVGDIPADMVAEADEQLFQITEIAAEADDELIEKYFDGGKLTNEEIYYGIQQSALNGKITLSFCGSATHNQGIINLMEAITHYMPSPLKGQPVEAEKGGELVEIKCDENAPFSAQIYKAIVDPFVGKLLMFKVMSGTVKVGDSVYNMNCGKSEKIGALYVQQGKKQEQVNELKAGDLGAIAKLSYTNAGDTLCDKSNKVLFSPINYPKPVISLHVTAENKDVEEKVIGGLHKLNEEDSTFSLEKNKETNQMILSGLGEMQLDVICKKLKQKYKVTAMLEDPRIPFRETIKKTVEQQGKYKKQSGGHGQYGDVHIRFEPNPEKGFEFGVEVVGGAVPKQYYPAVEKGLKESVKHGVLAGYPVVDIKCVLYFGSYHSVDSSEMAFKQAAHVAFKEGVANASPVLLEPIYKAEIVVPESYMGDILGDLNKRRGRILGMEPKNGKQIITADVPQAEMFKYATDLRSMTQGRGSFSMEFERYEEVPNQIAKKIIEDSKIESAKAV